MKKDAKAYSFEDFREIIRTLRSEDGCPWDRAQTHESLRSCMIEEAYEAVSAVNQRDEANLCEELGDVLLQVLLHSQIAEDEGSFTLDDVIQGISEKMIRRHPHVFGDKDRSDIPGWEEIKKQERADREPAGPYDGVPEEFPALIRAQKVLKKGAELCPVLKDEKETRKRIAELAEMLEAEESGRMEAEILTALLLRCVNALRLKGVHAEQFLSDRLDEITQEGQNTAKNLDKYM